MVVADRGALVSLLAVVRPLLTLLCAICVVAPHLVWPPRAPCSPRAAENFRQLCTGEHRPDGVPVGYKASRVHRILPGRLLHGGDLVAGDGSGAGGGIYGGGAPFRDETAGLAATHAGPGLLCSAAVERDANGSQWFVTFGGGGGGLDGQHVVFGKVVGGGDIVRSVGAVRVSPVGVPSAEVLVSECGEM